MATETRCRFSARPRRPSAPSVRELDAAGLTKPQWITRGADRAAGGGRPTSSSWARLAGALKRGTPDAEARVHELVAAGLLAPGDDDA